MGSDEEESHHVVFDTEAKEKLLNLLKGSKILEWKESYADPDILDGTQWGVRIALDEEELYKHGSNKYPRKWDAFCMGLSELVDREFQ